MYPNGYRPTEPKPEMSKVKPPKCGSAESSSTVDKASIELLDELYNENVKLRKKLKKARKEKKRWKKKYFKLYNDAMILKNTVDANPNSSSLERIEAGFGIEPIKNIK